MSTRALLARLAGHLPSTVVAAERVAGDPIQVPLFIRYLLCRLPGGGAVYLHHYLRSDPDRGLHDHPWDWAVALPLAGGYEELRLCGFGPDGARTVRRRRRPGLPYRLTGADFHSVLIQYPVSRTSSWSLFIHGRHCKPWGFLRPTRTRECPRLAYQYVVASGAQHADDVLWRRAAGRALGG